MNKFLLATIIAIAGSTTAFSQNAAPASVGFSDQTREIYNTIKNNLIGAANAMPEAEYSFKPAPEEMTFGQWIAHVATSQSTYCSILSGQMKRPDLASKTSKSDLVAALKASFDVCDPNYTSLKDADVLEMVSAGPEKVSRGSLLSYNLVHDNECYGSMAVYLRIKGIVPPSTAARAAAMGATGGRSAR